MNYLIYSDIHHRTDEAEAIFQKYEDKYKIVCLGDYFDHYSDSVHRAERTAQWLKYSLTKPNRRHCMGNHDAAYMFANNTALWCPGWTPYKQAAIRSILNQEDFANLKLFYYIEEGNWLLSHAGFTLANIFGFKHPQLANKGQRYEDAGLFTSEELIKIITDESRRFYNQALNNGYHHFMYQGSRMGQNGNGGPFWLHDSDFIAIKGLNQIFGHTARQDVRNWFLPNKKNPISINYCLDTQNKNVIFIEDGKSRVEKVRDI